MPQADHDARREPARLLLRRQHRRRVGELRPGYAQAMANVAHAITGRGLFFTEITAPFLHFNRMLLLVYGPTFRWYFTGAQTFDAFYGDRDLSMPHDQFSL